MSDGYGDWIQIRNLLSEYCHSIDERLFDDFEQLFTTDAVVTPKLAGTTYRGPAEIRAWLEAQPPPMRGLHTTTNPNIVVDGDDATVRADFMVYVTRGESSVVGAWGFYRDRLRRVDGRWLFAERQIETQWRVTDTAIVR
jgi:3-phenylpropionate/cinnamic acid dioxygenase small subunit